MLSADTEKKLFLLDAYALIYRAYFAFSKNPRINSLGQNTSAAFGFTNVLIDIIKNEKPTHIAVVFDPPGGSVQRQEDFQEYKANREAMPEDIRSMITPIKELIRAFNIEVIEVAGYEADDVVGVDRRLHLLIRADALVVECDREPLTLHLGAEVADAEDHREGILLDVRLDVGKKCLLHRERPLRGCAVDKEIPGGRESLHPSQTAGVKVYDAQGRAVGFGISH